MNIRISAFCRKERLSKNQTAKVYLRFTKNRRSRYVSTGISVPLSEWDFDTQTSTNKLVQIKIYEQIASYQKRIQRLEVLEIEPTLDKIIDKQQCCTNILLADYFKRVISYLESVDKFGTASKYKATLSLLHNFGMDNVRFNDIDIKYLQDFETALHLKGNQPNSIATKISVLKAVYNRALKERIFICQENPFIIYKAAFRCTPTKKRAMQKEDVLRLMKAPLPLTNARYAELSRDIFLFSYFSAGINFKDIALLRYSDIINDRIYYHRHKTGKEISFLLLPQSMAILSKYVNPDKQDSDYIFPILDVRKHKTTLQINDRVHKVLKQINRELKLWGERLGLKIKLTTYVARHTYATVLKRSGVNIAIISESLGHSDLSTTQIYLDSFENTQIDEAMRYLV